MPAIRSTTAIMRSQLIGVFACLARPAGTDDSHSAGKFARGEAINASARDDLDLAVDAVHDPELTFVGLVVVARDRAIFALRQDHAREGAD
jgi:hypothetical protein